MNAVTTPTSAAAVNGFNPVDAAAVLGADGGPALNAWLEQHACCGGAAWVAGTIGLLALLAVVATGLLCLWPAGANPVADLAYAGNKAGSQASHDAIAAGRLHGSNVQPRAPARPTDPSDRQGRRRDLSPIEQQQQGPPGRLRTSSSGSRRRLPSLEPPQPTAVGSIQSRQLQRTQRLYRRASD